VANASRAAEQIATLSALPSEIVCAGSLFCDGDLIGAQRILESYRRQAGEHVEALRLLGRIAQQRQTLGSAEELLEAALRLAPEYLAARLDLIRVLIARQKYLRAREVLEPLRTGEPRQPDVLFLEASVSAGLGDDEDAIARYRELLSRAPRASEVHVLLGHSFKAVGRQAEAIESYRAAAAARADFGDAYWSLANLKTYRFREDEIERMRAAEQSSATSRVDRYHLCFALGKAHEDRAEYAESWRYYELGNALKRAESGYRPEMSEAQIRELIETCTSSFFAARRAAGIPDPDPIFIVGLPRSGSTLLEQIIANHSSVDGTLELYDIPRLAQELNGPYPRVLGELELEDFASLGTRYIAGTRIYRKGKPLFIDKMVNNFRHIGLIALMLPNAKIIDVRRAPLACCVANLKQLFASGQEFSYGADYIARYYRGYLQLMRHWHAVLPGRVLEVHYEDLVEDFEPAVTRVLAFCGLKLERACLEFYRSGRPVRTASSEQVRRPIFREALEHWRHFEPWLDPLKEALGDALTRYRD
jgi:Tfp pilus assembly protein PilF